MEQGNRGGTPASTMSAMGPDAATNKAHSLAAGELGHIRLADYRCLRDLAWSMGREEDELTPEEAFALYERNWRHAERDSMDAAERELLKRLIDTIGRGVFLV
jgi:hypothetical protein